MNPMTLIDACMKGFSEAGGDKRLAVSNIKVWYFNEDENWWSEVSFRCFEGCNDWVVVDRCIDSVWQKYLEDYSVHTTSPSRDYPFRKFYFKKIDYESFKSFFGSVFVSVEMEYESKTFENEMPLINNTSIHGQWYSDVLGRNLDLTTTVDFFISTNRTTRVPPMPNLSNSKKDYLYFSFQAGDFCIDWEISDACCGREMSSLLKNFGNKHHPSLKLYTIGRLRLFELSPILFGLKELLEVLGMEYYSSYNMRVDIDIGFLSN